MTEISALTWLLIPDSARHRSEPAFIHNRLDRTKQILCKLSQKYAEFQDLLEKKWQTERDACVTPPTPAWVRAIYALAEMG